MKASIIFLVAILNWSVWASTPGFTVAVKSKNETTIRIFYNSINNNSNKPYIYAENIRVLVTGPRVFVEDKIEVFLDTYTWGIAPASAKVLTQELKCINSGEEAACAATVQGTLSLFAYMTNIQHELRVKVNGVYLVNPWPMLENPVGERFHLYLPGL